MRYLLTIIFIASFTLFAQAQPELDSWMLNTTGATASYNGGMGTVTLSDSVKVQQVCYNSTHVYVRSEGLAAYEMGPFPGNPNVLSAQNYTFKIPRNPTEETGTKEDNPWAGPLGITVNGIVIYGFGDARSYNPSLNANVGGGLGIWNSDAWVSEGSTMDANGAGHPDQGGNYHHHATPVALYSDPSTAHSPIIGFAFDGFPIYGPFGYTNPMDNASAIKRMGSGYSLRNITIRDLLPDGSTASSPGPTVDLTFPLGTYSEDYEHTGSVGDLDEYNGRQCVTPEYPGGTYAYFIATDGSGDPAFPYFLGPQFYGVVSSTDIGPNAGNASIPAGVSCGTTAGVNQIDQREWSLNVSPNPFTDQFVIRMEGDKQDYQIELINAQGSIVETFRPNSNVVVNGASLSAGVYYVRLTSENLTPSSGVRIVKL